MSQVPLIAIAQFLQLAAGNRKYALIQRRAKNLFEISLDRDNHEHEYHDAANGERPYRPGIGFGPVKAFLGIVVFDRMIVNFIGVAGVMFGVAQGLLSLGFAYVIGAAYALILLLNKKARMKSTLSFGPFLAMGGWIVLIFGAYLMKHFFVF